MKLKIMIAVIVMLSEVAMAVSIKVNQVGYYTSQKKIAIVGVDSSQTVNSFIVKDATGKEVLASQLKSSGYYDKTDENCYLADFSNVKDVGRYVVAVDGVVSDTFEITNTLYDDAFKKTLKSYYFQRCSFEINEEFGGKWARPFGHPDTSLRFDSIEGKTETDRMASPGGWYDAGDYGKYIVNAGITTWTLLNLYELFPMSGMDSTINIPESGNGQSDLLDEIKYELDWMLTMQDVDGGVFFKVGPNNWPSEVLPHADILYRYVIGKSTSSTLNFAFTLAAAGRIYNDYDTAYAKTCTEAAEKAYTWALEHSDVKRPENTKGSGPYADGKMDDEFFLATVELAKTTGEEKYVKEVDSYIGYMKVGDAAWWQDVTNLAFYALVQPSEYIDESISEKAIKKLVDHAVVSYKSLQKNPYHIRIDDFHWGSNGNIANSAMLYAYAYVITQEQPFLDAAIESMDYVFGKNGPSLSMVTGVGSQSVMKPHHRICTGHAEVEPFPGLVTGGANEENDGGDGVLMRLHQNKTPGGLCYKDNNHSWASNEPAINQNAPVVFMLGFLETQLNDEWNKRYE